MDLEGQTEDLQNTKLANNLKGQIIRYLVSINTVKWKQIIKKKTLA